MHWPCMVAVLLARCYNYWPCVCQVQLYFKPCKWFIFFLLNVFLSGDQQLDSAIFFFSTQGIAKVHGSDTAHIFSVVVWLSELQELGSEFVYGFIQVMDGEKDPRNLLTAFQIVQTLIQHFPIGKFCSWIVRQKSDFWFIYWPLMKPCRTCRNFYRVSQLNVLFIIQNHNGWY